MFDSQWSCVAALRFAFDQPSNPFVRFAFQVPGEHFCVMTVLHTVLHLRNLQCISIVSLWGLAGTHNVQHLTISANPTPWQPPVTLRLQRLSTLPAMAENTGVAQVRA